MAGRKRDYDECANRYPGSYDFSRYSAAHDQTSRLPSPTTSLGRKRDYATTARNKARQPTVIPSEATK
jgi:hypothetical protein